MDNIGLTLLVASIAGLGVVTGYAAPPTGLIFDDTFYFDQFTHQDPVSDPTNSKGANNGVGGKITVLAATPITNFALITAQDGPGDLKFLIYDQTTSSFLYESAPIAYPGELNNPTFYSTKTSPTFALMLLPTDVYFIGGIADSSTYYGIGASNNPDNPPGPAQEVDQNGVAGPVVNILFQNDPAPSTNGTGGTAQVSLQLFNGPVPEPSTFALLIAAVGVLGATKLRRSVKAQY